LRFKILIILICTFPFILNAQNKQAAIWHVGNKRLDFNTNPITITEVDTPFQGTFSSIALADSNGNFLLFASTQTNKLYNKNFQEVTNGNINVGTPSQQRLLFIPKPSNPNLVYLISPVNYSLIDIQNSTTIESNITWGNYGLEDNIYAIHHANCNDIWIIIAHQDGFYSHLVSNTGISNSLSFTPNQNHVGHRGCFSSSGKYFVHLNTVSQNPRDTVLIEFGELNRATGKFTITHRYKFNSYQMCFSSSFSPDGNKLYLFMQMRNSNTYHIYQTNIINGVPDFANSIIINTLILGGFSAYSSMQVAIDGKIYQTFYLKPKINIIHNPNQLGVACNYEDNAIPLTTAGNSLPIFISTWFSNNYCSLDYFAENNCLSDPTNFTINHTTNIQSVLWHFGDSQTSTILNPTHTYTNAGTYTVKLIATYTDNSTDTITKDIEIYDKPLKPIIEHE